MRTRSRLLAAALAASCFAFAAHAADFVNVLTGGTSGVYYPMGVALSQIYGKALPDTKVSVQATKASAENLNLLQSGRGDIAFTVGQSGIRGAWWSKQSREFIGEHPADHGRASIPRHLHSFSMMAEVIEGQTELPVLFSANDLAKLVDESRLTIRRKAHNLSFVAVVWEAEKLRGGRVDDSS